MAKKQSHLREVISPDLYPGTYEFELQIVIGLGQEMDGGNTKESDKGIDYERKDNFGTGYLNHPLK